MTNLNIAQRRSNDIIILDLDGKIKLGDGCAELHKTLRLLIERNEKRVLLNLQKVSYIDSSGLGELVSGYAAFKRNDGEMKLLYLSPNVHQLMTLTKLLTVFDIYENEMIAVENFDIPMAKAIHVSRLA
ncbi:MAG TPA: STAS domain-containing protein [Pyrinomonadaceae bacterium]|nr:STAS domain-containing protein [Pyrinomonadaceae bacterium]